MDGGEVVSIMPQELYLWGKSPDINWVGGWMVPRANLDAVEKRKISCPYQKLDPSVSSP
jgi:hypothetical protein